MLSPIKAIGQFIVGSVALGALSLGGAIPPGAAVELVANGDFESPTLPFSSYGIYGELPGWQLLPGSQSGIEVQNNVAGSPLSGQQFVELDGTGVSGIYQDLTTVVGQVYKLTFAFSARPGVADNKLNVLWGGVPVAALLANGTGVGDTQWQTFSYDVMATSTNTRLSFDNFGEQADSLGSYLDAVSVQESAAAVPEPTTILGALMAGCVVGARSRWKRKAH